MKIEQPDQTNRDHVLIVGGGAVDLEQLCRELTPRPMLIVAADRGGDWLKAVGVAPDLVMGDFDSLGPETLEMYRRQRVETLVFPVTKDETDMELALDAAIERGARKVRILGGLGGRMDHTFANIGLLMKSPMEIRLLDPIHEIFVVRSRVVLPRKDGWDLSLLPLTPEVSGITTIGLLYPLTNESLFMHRPRGVHNEFAAEEAVITVNAGILLVIMFMDR